MNGDNVSETKSNDRHIDNEFFFFGILSLYWLAQKKTTTPTNSRGSYRHTRTPLVLSDFHESMLNSSGELFFPIP